MKLPTESNFCIRWLSVSATKTWPLLSTAVVPFVSSKLYSNVAFFAGPSLAYGSKFHYISTNGTNNYIGFTTLGAYTSFEFSYKISYDLGLGISIYTSISKKYHVYGFQFQLYFSSAFKKNIK